MQPFIHLLSTGFLMLLWVWPSQAQEVNRDQAGQQSLLRLGSGTPIESVEIFNNRYREAEGSPYLDPAWIPGNILLVNGEAFDGYQLRLDTYQQRLEVSMNGQAQAFGPQGIDRFCLGDRGPDQRCFQRQKLTTEEGKQLPLAFYEMVFAGKSSLMILHSVKFFPASDKSQPYSSGEVADEYRPTTDFYFRPPGSETVVHFSRLSKGNLLKAIGEKSSELKSYAKAEKLNLRQPEDAAKLLAYYDQLSAR